jgi:aminoglycoside phosphotransferase (APT) family kinase protein
MNTGYALGEADTRALLADACAATGLNPGGARLLRLGSNAVYRLTGPIVARVGRAEAGTEAARRTVRVARWLESVGYPAVRAIAVDQPVVVDGHAVTFWGAVSDDGNEYATVAQVAEVIAQLHALIAPKDLRLPELQPFENASERIATSDWLTSDDRDFMDSELTRFQAGYSRLEFALPRGVIHGDASIGNVLSDPTGDAVVIDLDDFAIGPREWDLIQTALYYDRFGWHTRGEYETFVKVYGYDIMHWPGYNLLADIREFIIVTWMIQMANEGKGTSAEARKRLDALRTGGSRKDWLPF